MGRTLVGLLHGWTRSLMDLSRQIADQVELLRVTGESYDSGNIVTYKQLSVVVRVLVHDTYRSKSLLEQAGVKASLGWLSTGQIDPHNLLASNVLVWLGTTLVDGKTYMSYTPYDQSECLRLGEIGSFDKWWQGEVVEDRNGHVFSRREITLAVANKDGGAHVDDLPDTVRALAEDGSLGWSYQSDDESGPITVSPIPATMRTIATELLLTLHNQRDALGMAPS